MQSTMMTSIMKDFWKHGRNPIYWFIVFFLAHLNSFPPLLFNVSSGSHPIRSLTQTAEHMVSYPLAFYHNYTRFNFSARSYTLGGLPLWQSFLPTNVSPADNFTCRLTDAITERNKNPKTIKMLMQIGIRNPKFSPPYPITARSSFSGYHSWSWRYDSIKVTMYQCGISDGWQ